jgi:hypothetical protein
MSSGEDKAWQLIKDLAPADVCRNARVLFDGHSGSYILKSFGMDIHVDPQHKKIHCDGPNGTFLLERIGYFSKVSILWYLAGARDIPLSGSLVKPENLKGGLIFFRGTHVLPLDRLASRYQDDKERFLSRAGELGGDRLDYGDASVRLFPFTRVPVVIILRRGDDEFPPAADLLFDNTCELHLALDVLWAVAMQSILIMM